MAFEVNPYAIAFTAPAGVDLSSGTYTYGFVKLNGSGQVIPCAAVTDKPIGILTNAPGPGDAAEVTAAGIVKCVASAAITPGASIGTTTSGTAATYVQGTDTTKYIVGQALQATANAGELFALALNCPSAARGA